MFRRLTCAWVLTKESALVGLSPETKDEISMSTEQDDRSSHQDEPPRAETPLQDERARASALPTITMAKARTHLDQPLEVLLPERFHTAHVAHRRTYVTTPLRRPMGVGLDLVGRRKDGSEFPVDISLHKRARKPRLFRAGMNGPISCIFVLFVYTINMDYQHEQQTVHLIVYHIIWCPKRRRKVLVGLVHDRLKQIIEEVASSHHWTVIRLAIQPDHVHLFLRSNPYTMPTDIAHAIKGRSSHILREEFPHLQRMPSLWTRSTFYSTEGLVSAETIQTYIERQSKQ